MSEVGQIRVDPEQGVVIGDRMKPYPTEHLPNDDIQGKPYSGEKRKLSSSQKGDFVRPNNTGCGRKPDILEQSNPKNAEKPKSGKHMDIVTNSGCTGQTGALIESQLERKAGIGALESCSMSEHEGKAEEERNVVWTNRGTSKDIDKGWAWAVLLASWLSQVISGGAASSIGTFHLFLMDAFDGDPTLTATIGSLFSGLCMCLGPVASLISDITSVRCCMLMGGLLATVGMVASSQATSFSVIFVTLGIVSGIGLGLTFTPSVVIPGYYFLRRRSMACGAGVTGYSFGIVVIPLIIRALEEQYGWRGAFLVIGGLTLNLCVCGVIMEPSVLEKSRGRLFQSREAGVHHTEMKEKLCTSNILKKYRFLGNKRFWALFYVFFLSNVSMNIIFLYLPTYTDSLGSSTREMSLLYIVLGLFNMASRVLVGLATNDTGKGTFLDKTCLLFGSLSLQSIAILCFPLYSSTTLGRLSFAGIVGFYYGVQPSVTTPLTVDTVGLRRISPAVGMIMFGKGLGMVAGPPLATTLFNITQNYRDTFLFGGVVNVAAAIFCLLTTLCAPYSEELEKTNGSNPEQIQLVSKEAENHHTSVDT